MIAGFLFWAYRFRRSRLRRLIAMLAAGIEGGQFRSTTLRRIFSHYHGVQVGHFSYGGCFDPESMPPGTSVGRYCSFSQFRVLSRNHPTTWISTHPFFFNPKLGIVDNETVPHTKLVIGNDVWIGYGAVILPAVKEIGNGAVIGAMSVVTRNVPPYAVVVGNPGKVVKYRFSKDVRKRLEKSRWWDKDISELKQQIISFRTAVTDGILDGLRL